MNEFGNEEISKEEQTLIDSVSPSKLAIPVLLGIGAVVYLMVRTLNVDEFRSIDWKFNTFFWLAMAVILYVIRHIVLAWRLKVISNEAFSFSKCMELIVIWEFSSSVSPTSVGGSGVALMLLAQEKISGARTVSIVLYSMVVDTIYLIASLILLYVFLGPTIIRPGMESIYDIDGFGVTFFTVILFMSAYGGLFFYGLFINPNATKRLILLISKIPFLKKFKADLVETAKNVVLTSYELKTMSWNFHFKAMVATAGAWVIRFGTINCIILALVATTPFTLYDQLMLIARGESMYTITAFSPTPGGAGIAEYVFGGFYSDYIPKGLASLIALTWRLITYYPYLLLGAIIIPNWIRNVIRRRKVDRIIRELEKNHDIE